MYQFDFLRLLEIKLIQTDELNRKSEWELRPALGKSGFFRQSIADTLNKGKHTLKVVANGKTFQRELVKNVEVIESLFTVEQSIDEQRNQMILSLAPHAEVIDSATVAVQAAINFGDKPTEKVALKAENERWLLTVPLPDENERVIVNFDITAQTVRGAFITPSIKPVIIDTRAIRDLIERQTGLEKTDETSFNGSENSAVESQKNNNVIDNAEILSEDQENTTEVKAEKTVSEEGGSWGLVAGVVAGINILLFGLGYWGFKLVTRKTTEKNEKLLDRLT